MSTLKNKDCPAVQAHISMMQNIISRMANNSANCKTWAITIIAAMLVLIVDKNSGFKNIWICYIPVSLFFFLDCYYLGLERLFIKKQEEFLTKVESGIYVEELYTIKGISNFGTQFCATLKSIISFSTLPFYGLVVLFIYILGACGS